MFDCRSEFPGHEFKNTLIEEENGIIDKSATIGKPQANYIMEWIHQVISNFIQIFELDNNYEYDDEPYKGILVAEYFATHSLGFIKPYKITWPISTREVYDCANWERSQLEVKRYI